MREPRVSRSRSTAAWPLLGESGLGEDIPHAHHRIHRRTATSAARLARARRGERLRRRAQQLARSGVAGRRWSRSSGRTAARRPPVEAAQAGDIVVVTVPLKNYRSVPVEPLAGKIVIDTNNYYPQRDGHIPELDNESTTTAELLQAHLPSRRSSRRSTTSTRPSSPRTESRRARGTAARSSSPATTPAAKATVTPPARPVRLRHRRRRPAEGRLAHPARHARLRPAPDGGGTAPRPRRCRGTRISGETCSPLSPSEFGHHPEFGPARAATLGRLDDRTRKRGRDGRGFTGPRSFWRDLRAWTRRTRTLATSIVVRAFTYFTTSRASARDDEDARGRRR